MNKTVITGTIFHFLLKLMYKINWFYADTGIKINSGNNFILPGNQLINLFIVRWVQ